MSVTLAVGITAVSAYRQKAGVERDPVLVGDFADLLFVARLIDSSDPSVTFEKFRSIVDGGEKATVDFKFACNAFNTSAGDHEKARAELVKDICAMANNGRVASFLIVGIGDDRHTMQSIVDPKLNDENIQTLVRDAINPRPKVRLTRVNWRTAPNPYKGNTFVVIQVGPHPRHAFRLAQDKINFDKRIHFRKNEVWVRNGSTSDLASPEQIHALVSRRRPPSEETTEFENVVYDLLPRIEQLRSLSQDAAALFREIGAHISQVKPIDTDLFGAQFDFRVRVNLLQRNFVFRCCFAPKITEFLSQYGIVHDRWGLEDGFIVFLPDSMRNGGKAREIEVDAKETWGVFTIVKYPSQRWGARTSKDLPQSRIPILTLPKLSQTKVLRERLIACLDSLVSNEMLFDHLKRCQRELKQNVNAWTAQVGGRRFAEDFSGKQIKKYRSDLTELAKLNKR